MYIVHEVYFFTQNAVGNTVLVRVQLATYLNHILAKIPFFAKTLKLVHGR